MGFVAKVNEATSLEGLDAILMHCNFEGVDRISTHDLSLTQLTNKLQNTPLRFVFRPTTSSSIMFCSLQLAPTRKRFIQGLWFYRIPSLTLAIGLRVARLWFCQLKKLTFTIATPPVLHTTNQCAQPTACMALVLHRMKSILSSMTHTTRCRTWVEVTPCTSTCPLRIPLHAL